MSLNLTSSSSSSSPSPLTDLPQFKPTTSSSKVYNSCMEQLNMSFAGIEQISEVASNQNLLKLQQSDPILSQIDLTTSGNDHPPCLIYTALKCVGAILQMSLREPLPNQALFYGTDRLALIKVKANRNFKTYYRVAFSLVNARLERTVQLIYESSAIDVDHTISLTLQMQIKEKTQIAIVHKLKDSTDLCRKFLALVDEDDRDDRACRNAVQNITPLLVVLHPLIFSYIPLENYHLTSSLHVVKPKPVEPEKSGCLDCFMQMFNQKITIPDKIEPDQTPELAHRKTQELDITNLTLDR